LQLYNREQHHAHAAIYGGHDPAVCGYAQAAFVSWFLGYAQRAVAYIDKALAYARELAHAGSLVHAMDNALLLQRSVGDVALVRRQADAMIKLCEEQDFADYQARGLVFLGWSMAQEQDEQGLITMQEGIARQRATGIAEDFHLFLEMLADIYSQSGRFKDALQLLDEALSLGDRIGPYWSAELHRRKGELLLRSAQDSAAEAWFLKALAIARRQNAKILELRAAVNLAELWQRQNQTDRARMLLQPVYEGFREGLATADLQRARAALEALVDGSPRL
jgi:predicted ATPase